MTVLQVRRNKFVVPQPSKITPETTATHDTMTTEPSATASETTAMQDTTTTQHVSTTRNNYHQ